MIKKIHSYGFTLIELLVVIGILAILLAITLIAINPARQLSSANDTKRSADANAILNAISQQMVDSRGVVPAGIPVGGAAAIEISSTGADICSLVVPDYIAQLPVDPATGTAPVPAPCPAAPDTYVTGYFVTSNNGRVTVSAPSAQNGTIAVTR
ncbi:hypothetical protein A3C23_01475 [Candidatus Roizmanbacteria bacterium RIFCSPHIGHO2_02_FULL_37_13b]|uniref:Type II secretion system protein GspG C-terminal domain-containing protein n=1 Tax=Candidatus Roizmanbacteria bacterium RIFCSPLOWO2_02_FULL_36_11 TaxID=1802071 RepID=A0A1F7JIH5_9BACT|nr:MAG: hypothetical protein A3C23_01475 [Candidatus Roizmanbacteria bacterium RIFCSPHIGHO2_02_FULL_37_13b]OGK55408.1 MAG: hypothetical protein A3H78_05945 [Candidatus Roizmanbacteria bacterium RIFCSPLOWO2_02_FULL_36_11]